jgi:small subunit ribosomal protein S17
MATAHILPKANYKSLVGVVVNAGERLRTVRVRLPNQTYNSRLHKHFNDPKHVLVHDPRRSCEVGDVISLRSNWPVSKHVKHVVTGIVSPFGRTVEERPAVMTEEERVLERQNRRKAKDARQAERGRTVSQIRIKQTGKLESTEAHDEVRASKKLLAEVKGNLSVKVEKRLENMQTIILAENDLDLIKKRVEDVIKIGLEDGHEWALDNDKLSALTLWIAYRHAHEKHLYIGKDLPLLAGKSTSSAVIAENERMAAFMKRRALVYVYYFKRLSSRNDGRTKVMEACRALQQRLTQSWRDHVFETKESDAAHARQERRRVGKVTNSAAVFDDTNWESQVEAIHQGAAKELASEQLWWENEFVREAAEKKGSAATPIVAADTAASTVPVEQLKTLSVDEIRELQ